MEICDYCNIVFETKKCPLCEAKEQLDINDDEIKEMSEMIEQQDKEIEELKSQI